MLYILPVFKINCIANYRKKRGLAQNSFEFGAAFFRKKIREDMKPLAVSKNRIKAIPHKKMFRKLMVYDIIKA